MYSLLSVCKVLIKRLLCSFHFFRVFHQLKDRCRHNFAGVEHSFVSQAASTGGCRLPGVHWHADWICSTKNIAVGICQLTLPTSELVCN